MYFTPHKFFLMPPVILSDTLSVILSVSEESVKAVIKALLFFVLILALPSCKNDIGIADMEDGDRLVVNAILTAGEDRHAVFLSMSGSGTIKKIDAEKAVVTMSVNGEPGVKSSYYNDYDTYTLPVTTFYINQSITPGDNVRIDVEYDDMHASAEVTAPYPATISRVDTSSTTSYWKDDNQIEDVMRFRATIQDIQGEKNWYRLKMTAHSVTTSESGRQNYEDRGEIDIDAREDFVLSGGSIQSSSKDDYSLDVTDNKFHVFSDTEFADTQYTLNFLARKWYILSFMSPDYYSRTFSVDTYVSITVFTISEDLFRYSKAAELLESEDYDTSYMEAVNLVQNVSGGLGFVAVQAPTHTL